LPYSILIADDNPVVRQTLRTCLERCAEWVVCGEAEDGIEAVEKARQLRPDLVILDLSMPGMNGLDAARTLKLETPSARLLMFTSFKNPSLEREAVAAGCIALVAKSEMGVLFSMIRRIMSGDKD
jgi:DNA-binding NarL/FixJ family response regulator